MTTLERKRAYMISDSVDIQVEIEPVEFDDMANRTLAESSAEIRTSVMAARAFDRILRVARTIADLEYSSSLTPEEAVKAPVEAPYIAKALGYRALDRPSNFGIAF